MKIKQTINKNPLFFAFFFPALVDGIVTVLGQGSAYLTTPSVASDASPAYYFLIASPWLFLLGSITWFVFWYWLYKRLKEPVNLFLTFFFIAGHSWGSSSWIMKIMKEASVYEIGNQPSIIFAWFLLIFYFLVVAGITTYCLKLYFQKHNKLLSQNDTQKASGFFIQVNDKGGGHFRKYTEDSLQMLFDTSPSAANFELMVLVEGLVFMSLRTHFIIADNEEGYEKFLKRDDRLKTAIDKLVIEHIVDRNLERKLDEYRKIRNEIVHNIYRMKSFKSKLFPTFKDYSYIDAYKSLFQIGMGVFREFSEIIVPGKPSQASYLRRFRGRTKYENNKTN